jgi:hypothetical protein
MRWQTAGSLVPLLVGLTGCPDTYGRGGTIEQAVHKDALELHRKYDCPQHVYDAYCRGNTQSPECLEHCGGG